MAVKKGARSVMRKQLGSKKAADTILNKLDKMSKQKAPFSAIEKMLTKELTAYMEATIMPAVRSEVEIVVNHVVRPILIRQHEIGR